MTTPVLRFRVPEMPDVVHTIGSATFVTDVEGEAAVDVRDAQSGAVLGRWRQGVDTANTWTANVNVTAPPTDRPGFLLVTVLDNRARAVAVLPVMLSAVRQGASAG